jgi:hypothetical protein
LVVDRGLGAIQTPPTSYDVQRLVAGTNGTRLVADSTQTLGMRYDKVNLDKSAEVAGTLPIAQGGTGQTTQQAALNALSPPVPAMGDLLYFNGTNWTRLPRGVVIGGSLPQLLSVDALGTGIQWSTPNFPPPALQWITASPGSSGSIALDLSAALNFVVSASDNITIDFSNASPGQSFALALTVAGTKTLAWTKTIKWKGGSVPSRTGGGATDIWWFMYDGLNWYGAASLDFS